MKEEGTVRCLYEALILTTALTSTAPSSIAAVPSLNQSKASLLKVTQSTGPNFIYLVYFKDEQHSLHSTTVLRQFPHNINTIYPYAYASGENQ